MILDTLDIDTATFHAGTGWEIKPEGACKGEVCVPLAPADDGDFDLIGTAERLGMALVRDGDQGVWALGPASVGGRALVTADAPDVALPDLDGNEFHLASLRGKKIVMVAWAPY